MVISKSRIREFRCRYSDRNKMTILAAAVFLLLAPTTRANIVDFFIDQPASTLLESGKVFGPAIGNNTTVAQAPGSDVTTYYGHIFADLQPGTIQLLPGGSIRAAVTGNYAPFDPVSSAPVGPPAQGTTPGNYGLDFPTLGVVAVQYNFMIDFGYVAGAIPSTPIPINGGGQFDLTGQAMQFVDGREAFVSNLANSTNSVSGGPAVFFGTDGADIGTWDGVTLTIPIHSTFTFDYTPQFGGIQRTINLTGQLVAHPFVPEPSSFVLAALGLIGLVVWRPIRKPLSQFSVGALLGVLVLMPASRAQANLLTNGSFETDPVGLGLKTLTGWSVLSGTVDLQPFPGDSFTAKDGAQYLETVGTPGYATITQTFPTIADQQYKFTGWMAHHSGIGTQTAVAVVLIDNVYLGRLSHGGTYYEWRPFELDFTATSQTTELKIQDVTFLYDFGGLIIDGLAVTPVPEPSSFVLAALGLIGLVVWRRRKR